MTALMPRMTLVVSPCAWCRSFPCVCIRERPCACGGSVVVIEDVTESMRTHQRSRMHAEWRERNGL